MPADAREQVRQLPSGKWQLRYYDGKGVRHSGGPSPSKSAARAHYRNVIEPELSGRKVIHANVTFAEHVDRYLAAHATGRDASTSKLWRTGSAMPPRRSVISRWRSSSGASRRSPRGSALSRRAHGTGSSRRSDRRSKPVLNGGT